MPAGNSFSLHALEKQQKIQLIDYLSGFVSENRLARFALVINERTSHLHIVLENIYQAHNASAVLRSCESFGVQHVHFIENDNYMKVNDEVAMGSSNWLSIHRHRQASNNTADCLNMLKEQGYRIVATSPHEKNGTLQQLSVDNKFALVFGTEQEGISDEVKELADEFVSIPMYGFTESFNISVSAALCMYELTRRIRKEVKNYRLDEDESTDILLQWLINSLDHGEALVRNFLSKQ